MRPVQIGFFEGHRLMSTTGGTGKGMRARVERRMRRETGKTMREMRRAKKLRRKLMTDEERLIYSLRRAKKKVALLLQKLKKYELPELPAPRHDPELLTPEQLQAFKKIGYRNRNYVPVGVRGVFGGVVQNMHLHWKFHETVQVCCDNYPKEKIKGMASMLARLSGGIIINIHNVKTIIMFRGRNYRQPKNLIPINTLTKRKALFKARFEQALESQKLNIKAAEQKLRRMGVNPEDPIAMASIQRVASTFFRAIDEKQGSPYVFHGDKTTIPDADEDIPDDPPPAPSGEDSDQEELDRFIAEIEESADQEWEAEEAAEKEEMSRIRYWNREGSRPSNWHGGTSNVDHGIENSRRRTTDVRKWNEGNENSEESGGEDSEESGDEDSDSEVHSALGEGMLEGRLKNFRVTSSGKFRERDFKEDSESDNNMSSESENDSWDSDDNSGSARKNSGNMYERNRGARFDQNSKNDDECWDSDD